MLLQIEKLLSDHITLHEQVEIIERLNEKMTDPHTLFQLASYLLTKATLIEGFPEETVDIVGTGGDGYDTLNFSTMSAIVAAACGYKVAKHGNKSATSKCGSFDLLQKMSVPIPEDPESAKSQLEQNDIAFLFAPYFHPIMKNVTAARKAFAKRGEKTIFNLMGPLLNPGRTKRMSVGVYREDLVEPYAHVLAQLGVEYGYVAYGNGLDEFTVTGPTTLATINKGDVTMSELFPASLDLDLCEIEQLKGGDPDENYRQTMALLSGNLPGSKHDMIKLNAASAMVVASGFEFNLLEGAARAHEAISTGRVMKFLEGINP